MLNQSATLLTKQNRSKQRTPKTEKFKNNLNGFTAKPGNEYLMHPRLRLKA